MVVFLNALSYRCASCMLSYFVLFTLEKTCGDDGADVQCPNNKKLVDENTKCTSCDDNECCEGTSYISHMCKAFVQMIE